MSTMENVRYRLANDKYEPNSYYVDTGFMYIEQDLATGEVKDVTDVYTENQKAIEYPTQKPLAITNGSRPASVIMKRNDEKEGSVIITRKEGSVIIPKKEGSIIIPRKEGSVIIPRKEGSVIIPRREGSVIIPRRDESVLIPSREMSVVNGSVIRTPVAYPQRVVHRVVSSPRQNVVLSPRGQRIITPQRPQTVRVVRSNGYVPNIQRIPEERVQYVMDDSNMPVRYVTRRVVSGDEYERDYADNMHKLYKTTINVSSSESSDSGDSPKEVVKTRYISSPSNRFKNVKGVPEAKIYIPTPNSRPSKNSSTDNSSLDSVDIHKFEKDSKKSKKDKRK